MPCAKGSVQCAEPFFPSLKSFKSENFLVSLLSLFSFFFAKENLLRFLIPPGIERIDDMASLTTFYVFRQA